VILLSISTRHFRNLETARLEFHRAANVFVGPNGQGKTNYLEAIYFLATTKSFRTNRVANLAAFDRDHIFVEGLAEKAGLQRKLSVGLEAASSRRRELLVNGQKTPLEDYVEHLPVFAYSAARLEILRGAPDVRRKFLDRGIASVRKGFIRELSKYARVLKQRNTLLDRVAEGSASESSLDPWDIEFDQTARRVVAARRQYVEDLTREYQKVVEALDYHVDSLRIIYEPSGAFEETEETSLEAIRRLRRRELMTGFSLSGPHRDVLRFEVSGRDAAEVLSSGEVKMTVLFLKLAKIDLYRQKIEDRPIFVFDDIDAELDLTVTERLISFVGSQVQLFTSSAKEEVLDRLDLGPHRRFRIAAGGVFETV
jgi:DNA replication and repair protein RecF